MQPHRKVRNGSRVPPSAIVYEAIVDKPSDAVWLPIDHISMNVGCGVEAEVDAARRATIPEPQFGAIVTRIEVDVQ